MGMGRPSSGKQLNGVYMGMGGHPYHHHPHHGGGGGMMGMKRSLRAPRMRWTSSLHAHFVHAVELLGGHESKSSPVRRENHWPPRWFARLFEPFPSTTTRGSKSLALWPFPARLEAPRSLNHSTVRRVDPLNRTTAHPQPPVRRADSSNRYG